MNPPFSYPDLSTETFDGMRWYKIDDETFFPSITTILGTTQSEETKKSLANWRTSLGPTKADAASKAACDHGTNVHLLAERYLKNQKVDDLINGQPVSSKDLGAFKTLKSKLDKVDEVWGQECALFSREFEIAGRCDLVGTYKGIPCIVDFKTAGRIKDKKDIADYNLQLAFYGASHNEMYGTNIKEGVVLMVADSGFPLEFHVNLEEFYEPLKARSSEFWRKVVNKNY